MGRAALISSRDKDRNSCRGLARSSERATPPKMAAAAVVGCAAPPTPAMEHAQTLVTPIVCTKMCQDVGVGVAVDCGVHNVMQCCP